MRLEYATAASARAGRIVAGLGMVAGFLAVVFVGTSDVDVVLLIIAALLWQFALMLCNSMVYA